ncbi:DUF4148 domain-containing protein [Paraburkholderia ferrariae]|jgi:hypothetical protein|uniref:DUF4148 domain-containing protein n=1 Tax=Paraburkholderia ferrariae TaxID=386056 RepID=UPI0004879B9B|nr:DUF4148 domain-containing protein [Paraburkholderia ferrariae]
MNAIAFCIAAGLAACGSASAYAQTSPDTNNSGQPTISTTAAAATTTQAQTTPYNGGWVPPYGEPVHEKTRAEVYQELIQAEKDGQLDYLNSTLYAH